MYYVEQSTFQSETVVDDTNTLVLGTRVLLQNALILQVGVFTNSSIPQCSLLGPCNFLCSMMSNQPLWFVAVGSDANNVNAAQQ